MHRVQQLMDLPTTTEEQATALVMALKRLVGDGKGSRGSGSGSNSNSGGMDGTDNENVNEEEVSGMGTLYKALILTGPHMSSNVSI